jgi:hypothetical protein
MENIQREILVDIIFHSFHVKYSYFNLSVFYCVTYTSSESTQGGRYNVVGVVASYGLDVFGFKSRVGLDFPYPSRAFLGSTQLSVEWVANHFLEVKTALGVVLVTRPL